jgi:hypothetical protein
MATRHSTRVPTQPHHDPALNDLYGAFHLSLIARLARACGHHRDAVMDGELLVGALA